LLSAKPFAWPASITNFNRDIQKNDAESALALLYLANLLTLSRTFPLTFTILNEKRLIISSRWKHCQRFFVDHFGRFFVQSGFRQTLGIRFGLVMPGNAPGKIPDLKTVAVSARSNIAIGLRSGAVQISADFGLADRSL